MAPVATPNTAATPSGARTRLKRRLAPLGRIGRPQGAGLLIYHRIGTATDDELEVRPEQFAAQLDVLDAAGSEVVALDTALDRIACGDDRPAVVITFDDGFADVYERAWPLLSERGWPFTVYLATAYVGATMRWEGAQGDGGGRGLTWDQLGEMAASGLCTVGNHTHTHVLPSRLSTAELDRCSDAIEAHLGVRPDHFAYPWGVDVASMHPALDVRFRSAATGAVGRNHHGADLLSLRRLPVRRTDPVEFFRAKVAGGPVPEYLYGAAVGLAKSVRKLVRPRAGSGG